MAFTSLALFNVMRFPLSFLPMIINFIIESRRACPPAPTHLPQCSHTRLRIALSERDVQILFTVGGWCLRGVEESAR